MILSFTGCGQDAAPPPAKTEPAAAEAQPAPATRPQEDTAAANATGASATEQGANQAEALIARAMQPWTGNLDGMIERRMVRVQVPFSKTFYFVDRGRQRGITYEGLKKFEDDLNRTLQTGALKLHVVFIPASRDRLIPGLLEGVGDIAAGNLTITPERQEQIDFSAPLYAGVREIVLSGPATAALATLDDLAGREIVVRRSSSYYQSLLALNERFRQQGKQAVAVTPADERLEDEDLIEMLNAGLYPLVVADLHKARFWQQVLPDIVVHEDIVLRDGGEIAWALREDSPKLRAALDAFVKEHKTGTTFGNIMLRRHFKDADNMKNALNGAEVKKFRDTLALFQKYAGEYQFDWLMIAAQAYHESGVDQSVRSAVGVMLVMPKTAAGAPILIPDVYNIDNNIHAGVKYLRFMIDEYFNDPQISDLDRLLFAFASYNGGPNRIDRLRRKAATQGLDPNRWFQNVEIVVARHIGRETTQYVGNIFKYYVAYRRLADELEARNKAREHSREGVRRR